MSKYRVAPLLHHDDDPEFFLYIEDAEENSIKNSIDDGLWGVWDEESGILISIAYGSELFSS